MTDYNWRLFVHALGQKSLHHYDEFKAVQLAQAMVESGRGTSTLFLKYGNPYGMKFRTEMSKIATPVTLEVSDGVDTYCCFESEQSAVDAYWVFIGRSVYKGWEKCVDRVAFLKHLINCGYVGTGAKKRNDYFESVS